MLNPSLFPKNYSHRQYEEVVELFAKKKLHICEAFSEIYILRKNYQALSDPVRERNRPTRCWLWSLGWIPLQEEKYGWNSASHPACFSHSLAFYISTKLIA